ncbi:hypothetical protein MPPM_0597 [Methylorubrum populi]|uniref:Uncharacterized protein n=1 Tax=Methylorubrum populi TaxID=223967 RepID=A0A169QMU3_9HYPH|nr:hypothetical protein [Methylorubrum populi]BAU89202.1 hypothetical protein MPPM_0597 [Methylorubrum populi]
MSLPTLAENVSGHDARPILFGLFADGSGETRFLGLDGAPFGDLRARSERPRFSPSGDWYGRWAVQPLHGILTPRTDPEDRGVCPEDIVVLRPRHHVRRS